MAGLKPRLRAMGVLVPVKRGRKPSPRKYLEGDENMAAFERSKALCAEGRYKEVRALNMQPACFSVLEQMYGLPKQCD